MSPLLVYIIGSLVPFIYVPIIFTAGALKSAIERRPRSAPAIKLLSGVILVVVVVFLW